jgi:hypothetical protein
MLSLLSPEKFSNSRQTRRGFLRLRPAPFESRATITAHWTQDLVHLPLAATLDADRKKTPFFAAKTRSLECRLRDLTGKHLSICARAIHIESRPVDCCLHRQVLPAIQKIVLRCTASQGQEPDQNHR